MFDRAFPEIAIFDTEGYLPFSTQWEFHSQTIFCGDIHLHKPYIGLLYGRYLHFRILKFPLINLRLPPVLSDSFGKGLLRKAVALARRLGGDPGKRRSRSTAGMVVNHQ